MKNIMLLDCTLRDGGRIIDCAFPDDEIKEIAQGLSDSHIDIIEVGFLRDWRKTDYKGNSTFFTDVSQISGRIGNKNKGIQYVAFIDYGMFDFDSLAPYDGTSVDGIRFGFTKKDYLEHYDDLMACMCRIKQSGYKLFIQGVNSLNYTDIELLQLVQMVNEVHPYSFGIVDTYGAMYIDDVDRIYGLVDNNMNADICLDFHSHNNYQMSFALAQEVIKLSKGVRKIIIDGTLYGMGKVAGNLNTELIACFLAKKLNYNYNIDLILDLIDEHIYKHTLDNSWGYSISALMSGIYRAHPNNVMYLTKKFRLDSKDIGKILSLIAPDTRQRYDYDNIEQKYIEYMSQKVDDRFNVHRLKEVIGGKDVLVLSPGNSLTTYGQQIDSFVAEKKPVVISVSFVSKYRDAFAFFANSKRYKKTDSGESKIILTSNIQPVKDEIIVNYQNLVASHKYRFFDNSVIMLLNLLKKILPRSIYMAGFDGFSNDLKSNYMNDSFQNDRHRKDFELQNSELKQMFCSIRDSINVSTIIRFLTPSLFSDDYMFQF